MRGEYAAELNAFRNSLPGQTRRNIKLHDEFVPGEVREDDVELYLVNLCHSARSQSVGRVGGPQRWRIMSKSEWVRRVHVQGGEYSSLVSPSERSLCNVARGGLLGVHCLGCRAGMFLIPDSGFTCWFSLHYCFFSVNVTTVFSALLQPDFSLIHLSGYMEP